MAIEKTLNTRLKLRYDSHEAWMSSDPKLLEGEVALSAVSVKQEGTVNFVPSVLIKVGDGEHKYSELDFTYAKAADVVAAAKTEAALTAFVNNVITASGLATNDALTGLTTRVTTAEGEIDALQADLNTAETGLKARMTAIEGLVGEEEVAIQITKAIAALDLANSYDTKGAAAQALADAKSHANGLNTAMNTRVEALEAIDHDHANKAELDKIAEGDKAKWDAAEQNAKDHADDLDEAMDIRVKALEDKFGTGDGNVASQISAAVAAEAKLRDDADKALQELIEANDADILALQGLVGEEEVGIQITNITNPLANRVAAIEGDYLKNADKTALQGQITANANAIELLTNGVKADEVDGVNDLIQYVKDHGTEVTGIKADIKANSDAVAAEKTRAEGIEGGLNTRLQAVEAKLTDDGAVKSDIDAALTEAKGYTDAEVKKLTEGAIADNAADIKDLQGLVGEDTVSKQITDVTNPLAERVEALEAIDHEHANKTVLDGIDAADISAWDAKVDSITAATDSGLKATRTGNAVAIEIDDSVVFIFDCGGASV